MCYITINWKVIIWKTKKYMVKYSIGYFFLIIFNDSAQCNLGEWSNRFY